MPESQFLFSFQNVEKEANAIANEEMTQFRTMSKVLEIHI